MSGKNSVFFIKEYVLLRVKVVGNDVLNIKLRLNREYDL